MVRSPLLLAALPLLFALGCTDRDDPNFGGTPDPSLVDEDNDGYFADVDCDDDDASVSPTAEELCDGLDNDCDDETDEADATDASTWFTDADGDGYGDPSTSARGCFASDDQVTNDDDCNDDEDDSYPGGVETCDNIDNDCNQQVDDNPTDPQTWYADHDDDGYGTDGDMMYACDQPDGFVAYATDCDDSNAAINPLAPEVCDEIDNDCNDQIDEGVGVVYYDDDGDGYGDPLHGVDGCDIVPGSVDNDTDCDDTNAAVNPAAAEVCDGLDNNCDGVYDEGASTVYADADGDGYGDPSSPSETCEETPGYVDDATDCDDADGSSNPGASELADGADNDCDGLVDEATTLGDDDLDGWTEDDGDCDDADNRVNPGESEVCNDGLDNDCSGDDNGCRLDGDYSAADADAILVAVSGSDHAGTAVGDAGDINGDGWADVLVGAPDEDSGGADGGAVYAVYGPISGELSLGAADAVITADAAGDQLGQDLAGADLDADGYADLIYGGYLSDGVAADSGVTWLTYGPYAGAMGASDADGRLLGEAASDHAGYSVDSVGDADGDGDLEVIVGAISEGTAGYNAGAVYLISSGSGDQDLGAAELKVVAAARGDSLGLAVAGAGDTDGDGLLDLIGTAPDEDSGGASAGAAYLISGGTTGSLTASDADGVAIGELAGDTAGCSAAGGADLNGDGYADALIGAEYVDSGATDAGAAYVIYGPWAAALDLSSADATLLGGTAKDRAGHAVGFGQDVDQDGAPEALIGAIYEDTGARNGGATYLFYDAPSGSIGLASADVRLLAEVDADRLGRSVAGLGDVNADGAPDLGIGAHQSDRGATDGGAAFVFFGGAP